MVHEAAAEGDVPVRGELALSMMEPLRTTRTVAFRREISATRSVPSPRSSWPLLRSQVRLNPGQ